MKLVHKQVQMHLCYSFLVTKKYQKHKNDGRICNMKKKLVATLLSAAMVTTMFVGCGTSGEVADKDAADRKSVV